MSTRCQVKVTNKNNTEPLKEDIWLYHHMDGYPSNMVPLIQKAYDYEKTEMVGDKPHQFEIGLKKRGWEKGRVFKVASLLCAVDPCQFEPLPYQEVHGDIEFFYVIRVADEKSGPVWYLTAHSVPWIEGEIKMEQMRVIIPETRINEIEPKMYKDK